MSSPSSPTDSKPSTLITLLERSDSVLSQMRDWLTPTIREALLINASDIDLVAEAPPIFHTGQGLREANSEPLDLNHVASVLALLLKERLAERPISRENMVEGFLEQRLLEHGSGDFSVLWKPCDCRLRICFSLGQPGISLTIRLLSGEPKALNKLGLPTSVTNSIETMLSRTAGLILVTGVTNSGKSTTLAAMVNHLRMSMPPKKIVTIEDPIEWIFPHFVPKSPFPSFVFQREIHQHVPTFAVGLEQALRMRPDVVMMGELRNRADAESALRAVETGKLVMTTLHSRGLINSVRRLLDLFPSDYRSAALNLFADNLLFFLSQGLLPSAKDEGRVLNVEFFKPSSENKASILEFDRNNAQSLKDALLKPDQMPWDRCLETLANEYQIDDNTRRHHSMR